MCLRMTDQIPPSPGRQLTFTGLERAQDELRSSGHDHHFCQDFEGTAPANTKTNDFARTEKNDLVVDKERGHK